MPKLGVFSGAEICRILEDHGFINVRQRGSENTTITVPVPNHRTIRTGTLLSIIRQTGVAKDKFMR